MEPGAFQEFKVVIIHRDATGAIVEGYGWNSDVNADRPNLKAGGRTAFRLGVPGKLPLGDKYEAFARPWDNEGSALISETAP